MLTALQIALVALVTFALMEPWAAILHGRVWHGVLYVLHRSHHVPRAGRFEANDLLSAAHAPIAIAMILWGCLHTDAASSIPLRGVGIGMTLFGLSYSLVHDGLVHERLPVAWLARWRWLARVRAAHRVHHERGEAPFGLFLGPQELKRAITHGRSPVRSRAPSA